MSLVFERVLLEHLTRGTDHERFQLSARSEPWLKRALQADLRSADPAEAVLRVLKLAAAFDGVLASPPVARRIRSVLEGEQPAVTLIRETLLKPKALDEKRAFARREGREAAVRAPSYGEKPPPNGVPLRKLLNPTFGGSVPRVIRGRG